MMNGSRIWPVFLLIVVATSITAGGMILSPMNNQSSEQVITETVTSSWGISYTVSLYPANNSMAVRAINPTDGRTFVGYGLYIDDRLHNSTRGQLKAGESFIHRWNITSTIDVTIDNHTVLFTTSGNSTYLNFTRKINSTNPGPIPVPHITDVRVANGTVDGESSTVAYVTVANPSNQLYPTKLLVHTVETGGGLYGASVRPGENRTIKVELLEERGLQIAGEARLYVGEPSEREDALDQVEFVGRAGEETAVYNRSYRPITPPWRNDPYTYENGSISSADDGLFGTGFDLSADDVPAFAYLGAAVVVVLGLLLRRRT